MRDYAECDAYLCDLGFVKADDTWTRSLMLPGFPPALLVIALGPIGYDKLTVPDLDESRVWNMSLEVNGQTEREWQGRSLHQLEVVLSNLDVIMPYSLYEGAAEETSDKLMKDLVNKYRSVTVDSLMCTGAFRLSVCNEDGKTVTGCGCTLQKAAQDLMRSAIVTEEATKLYEWGWDRGTDRRWTWKKAIGGLSGKGINLELTYNGNVWRLEQQDEDGVVLHSCEGASLWSVMLSASEHLFGFSITANDKAMCADLWELAGKHSSIVNQSGPASCSR